MTLYAGICFISSCFKVTSFMYLCVSLQHRGMHTLRITVLCQFTVRNGFYLISKSTVLFEGLQILQNYMKMIVELRVF